MKIDGRAIAEEIFQALKEQTAHLKEKNIIPHVAIILLGNDPASESYVKRKVRKTEEIGGIATVIALPEATSEKELLQKIAELNQDKNIHGIIVQRPLPHHINGETIDRAVLPEKDVDAFHPKTKFDMPLAKAVLTILEHIFISSIKSDQSFELWLKNKQVVVIGKGQTGGGPVITLLKKMGIQPFVVDSKTQNAKALTQKADILISAVGRRSVVMPDMIKKGVILVSVGMHKATDGKFYGDYNENEIKEKALFYTPIPGGVGPVNVVCLLENLLRAAKMQSHS